MDKTAVYPKIHSTLALRCCWALLSGGAAAFGFAPFAWAWLLPLCCSVLLRLWQASQPREAFVLGLSFGCGFFGIGVSWVYVCIHVYAHTPAPLALLFTGLFTLVLALFVGLVGLCWRRFFSPVGFFSLMVTFPSLWVASELLRSKILGGFPWLLLGQASVDSFWQAAVPLFGQTGASFLVAALAGGLLACWQGPGRLRWFGLAIGVVALLGLFSLRQHPWTHPCSAPVRVSLVQGNIPQSLKWDPKASAASFYRYLKLSERADPQSKLILWPEGTIEIAYPWSRAWLRELKRFAHARQTTLVTGLPFQIDEQHFLNGLMAIGKGRGVYYKRHLVPFGEYLPLASLLRGVLTLFDIPMSDFVPGGKHLAPVQAAGFFVAPSLCYDIAYEDAVTDTLPKSAWIITLSNDGWYGRSFGLAQHLQIARTRALEAGRDLLFSTGNGITAIVDDHGKIRASLPVFTEAVLNGLCQPREGLTPTYRHPLPWPSLLFVLVCLSFLRTQLSLKRK